MSSMLWKTSFILRALSPLSLDHDFLHLRLLTQPEDDDLQLAGDDYLFQWLCLSLSRAAAPFKSSTMRSPFCVAFPISLTAISVVFPAGRKIEMKLALQRFLTNFSEIRLECTPEEELNAGLTMENVLLCGLRASLVRDGWTVLDGNLALQGSVKEWLDGTATEAVAFGVHTEANDCIDFVLSPDVIRIRPFKIEKLLIGPLKKWFDDGGVVALDDYMENLLPDDILEMKCLVLPSMQEGLVSGCSRGVPKEFNLRNHKEIWNERHGLVLPSEVFYIQVSFPFEGSTRRSWFPSCLVLRSCGLIPALPSVRAARMRSIISKITSSISRRNYMLFLTILFTRVHLHFPVVSTTISSDF